MASPIFDIERAAAALVDTHFMSVHEAAARHGIASRTLSGYRKRLQGDSVLLTAYLRKIAEALQSHQSEDAGDWINVEVKQAVDAALKFCEELPTSNQLPRRPGGSRAVSRKRHGNPTGPGAEPIPPGG